MISKAEINHFHLKLAEKPPDWKCTSQFDAFLGRIPYEQMKEFMEKWGTPFLVPKGFLFGTQKIDEYDLQKRTAVELRFKKCGIRCLMENPPVVCYLPENDNSASLLIIDGHHRVRYLGNHREGGKLISHVPVVIFNVSQMVQILNGIRLDGEPKIDEQDFIRKLQLDMFLTLESFESIMPADRLPKSIPNVGNVAGLKNLFPTFPFSVNQKAENIVFQTPNTIV